MKIAIITKNRWKQCKPTVKIDNLWKFWKCENQNQSIHETILNNRQEQENEINKWRRIESIIEYHTTRFADVLNKHSAEIFHFGSSEQSDYDIILNQNQVFKRQSFIWTNKDDQSDDEIPSDDDSEWEENWR